MSATCEKHYELGGRVIISSFDKDLTITLVPVSYLDLRERAHFVGFADKFSKIGTKIGDAIGGAVKSGLNGVLSMIENIINKGIGLINGAIDIINKIPGVDIGKIEELALPRLAKGGIVDRPTIAEIGERGREAVVPLENNTDWMRKLAKEISSAIGSNNGQPIIIENHVYLEGEAKGVFKLVREQNNINTRVTGINALATS